MATINESPKLDFKTSFRKPWKGTFVAGVAMAVLMSFWPNYYKSEARLLPSENGASGGMGNLMAAAAALGVGVGGGGGNDTNFVDILKSRWMYENLLNSVFHFHAKSWRFGSEKEHDETLYAYLAASNMDKAVKALDKIMDANKDLKSNLITLSAETLSPELSQQINHRALELLNQFMVQNSRTRGSEKALFAEGRLADARQQMDLAEAAFRQFLEANRNYQTSAEPSVRLKGARLEGELNLRRQLVSTLALNREQALLDARNDLPVLNILDEGNLPYEKSKPRRSMFVIAVMALSFLGLWGWQERNWLLAKMSEVED